MDTDPKAGMRRGAVPLLFYEANSARLDGIAAKHQPVPAQRHRAALIRKEQGSSRRTLKSALRLMFQVRTGAAETQWGDFPDECQDGIWGARAMSLARDLETPTDVAMPR